MDNHTCWGSEQVYKIYWFSEIDLMQVCCVCVGGGDFSTPVDMMQIGNGVVRDQIGNRMVNDLLRTCCSHEQVLSKALTKLTSLQKWAMSCKQVLWQVTCAPVRASKQNSPIFRK